MFNRSLIHPRLGGASAQHRSAAQSQEILDIQMEDTFFHCIGERQAIDLRDLVFNSRIRCIGAKNDVISTEDPNGFENILLADPLRSRSVEIQIRQNWAMHPENIQAEQMRNNKVDLGVVDGKLE